MARRLLIGVVGAGQASEKGARLAEKVGRRLAEAGAVLVCGGLGGVMEAACRGAVRAGGETIGLLPGPDPAAANDHVTLALPTGLGHARNVLIAQVSAALIAVDGEYGTLSEIAIGLKLGRPVVAIGSRWQVPGIRPVETAEEAVELALRLAEKRP
ncbi:hypothetical protein EDC39_105162 [Geothermobacter ehrlichii]|uniref:TIGR00725 family protein n=1 Tax=Geothermobacter ehrlichii TaxID=213224 RepID=A0A5D3WLF4_9BACT|nr:TIGR00725 family protein [Geothermobacter ehrlichii]TYO98793.1 hypothetical protein EDC39_105162 [Geothermobacter ehrlichii]